MNETAVAGGAGHPTPTQPLSMGLLDSLTVHTKMSLIHNIVSQVMQVMKVSGTFESNQFAKTNRRSLS